MSRFSASIIDLSNIEKILVHYCTMFVSCMVMGLQVFLKVSWKLSLLVFTTGGGMSKMDASRFV